MTYAWQKMRILRKSSNIVDWNVWKGKDRKEVIIKEVEKLACDWVTEQPDTEFKKEEFEKWEMDLNVDITVEEYDRALKVNLKSAPGKDSIDYKMIKELPDLRWK